MKMKPVLKMVSLTDIRINGKTQARKSIDPHWVLGMVENMKIGIIYDPVEARFDGSNYWLSNGFHRYHAYTQLGIKEIEVAYLPGSQFDAQLDAIKANNKHGKPLDRDDKENKVLMALDCVLVEDKSNYAIAKLCEVSQSFVAAVRDPKVKEKQAEAKKQHIIKKASKIRENDDELGKVLTSQTSNQSVLETVLQGGDAPDESEIKAAEEAMKADQEMMYKLLESDEPLKVAVEENKRLNLRVAQLETRLHGLMNERNEAVKMIKKLQKENDKLKAKK
jgi:ParB-like nuclease domain